MWDERVCQVLDLIKALKSRGGFSEFLQRYLQIDDQAIKQHCGKLFTPGASDIVKILIYHDSVNDAPRITEYLKELTVDSVDKEYKKLLRNHERRKFYHHQEALDPLASTKHSPTATTSRFLSYQNQFRKD